MYAMVLILAMGLGGSRRNVSSPLYGPTRHCCGAILSGTRSTCSSLSSSARVSGHYLTNCLANSI